MSRHITATSKMLNFFFSVSIEIVDAAGIKRKKMRLLEGGALKKGQVDLFSERARRRVGVGTSWHNREVSRGHSTYRKRAIRKGMEVSQVRKD